MSATVASLNIKLGASTGALSGDLTKAQGMLSAFTAKANAGGAGAVAGAAGGGGGLTGMLTGLVGKINPVTAGLAGLGAAAAGMTWATKLAADAQSMQVSFEVMLGSAEKAKTMMGEIQAFAGSTPFESMEVAGAAKSLLAFGVAQDQVIPSMRMLGDLASGLNIPLGELSELYGKAKVQGRLFMEDINQLTGRGIPIITQLANNFGVAESEIRGMVEAGKIGFPQLQSALNEMTKEGSQFGGMMEKQSQTFWGQLSTLWDNIKIAIGGVGGQFIGMLTNMLKLVNAALESWNKLWGNTPKDGGKAGKLDPKLLAEGMKPAENVKKQADEAKQAADKLAKDAADAMAKLKADGVSLANSLRTPFEQIAADLQHAKNLLDAGAISGETYARALAKASEELKAQSRSADEIREKLRAQQGGPVAALQSGTQAAISAVTKAAAEAKLQVAVQKEMAKELKLHTARLAAIERAVIKKEPLELIEARL